MAAQRRMQAFEAGEVREQVEAAREVREDVEQDTRNEALVTREIENLVRADPAPHPQGLVADPAFPQPVRGAIPPWLQVRLEVRCTQEWVINPFYRIPVDARLVVVEFRFGQSLYAEDGEVMLDTPDMTLGSGPGSVGPIHIPLSAFPGSFQPVEGEGGGVPARPTSMYRAENTTDRGQEYVAVGRVGRGNRMTASMEAGTLGALHLMGVFPEWLTPHSWIVSGAATAVDRLALLPPGTVGMIDSIDLEGGIVRIAVGVDTWSIPVPQILEAWGPYEVAAPPPPPPARTAYEHLDEEG